MEKFLVEFCLFLDGSLEVIFIDLFQKKGLVKVVNIVVDFIVVYFGISWDFGVKVKLGNSFVSFNVGYLVLKYLCFVVCVVLEDGFKVFVLDVIIGQCKNMLWSVVEVFIQLGLFIKVLYGFYNKVS